MEKHGLPADAAVDEVANEVAVAVVAGGLLDQRGDGDPPRAVYGPLSPWANRAIGCSCATVSTADG